jgi:hypothetical protein
MMKITLLLLIISIVTGLLLGFIILSGKLDGIFERQADNSKSLLRRRLFWGIFCVCLAALGILTLIFDWPIINPKW